MLNQAEALSHSHTNLKTHIEAKQPSSQLGKDLPDANSYWEGWVHYYHYTSGPKINRPNKFFQNNEFFSQRVPLQHVKKTDKHGSIIVPNKSSFYAVLSKNAIQIYSTREDPINKQVDYLQYSYINTIPEDQYLKGGVKDMGAFATGHCIEISAKVPNGKKVGDMANSLSPKWIICSDKDKEKQKLLKTLLKLKLKQQRKLGNFSTASSIKTAQAKKTTADLLFASKTKIPKDDREGGKVSNPTDGYWIILQNWTDCTLKCGGGKSYQQWRCIPPRNGGKPCKGKAIRVRSCNIQKCPGAETMKQMAKVTEPKVMKPIVTVAPFSSRLQRYSKCVVKENDSFLVTLDEKKNERKMPVRVVMNNMTLSIYKNDFYQDAEYVYQLDKTSFKVLNKEFCCFEVQDSLRSNKLCGYENNCGTPKNNEWVSQWAKDFKLFKVDCRVGRQTTLLNQEDKAALKKALQNKLKQARLDIIAQKQNKLRQSILSTQTNNDKKKVENVQDTGFKAIEKELQLENMIKNEEKAKEEMEIEEIKKKIEKEKQKQKCMQKTIKERDLDAEFIAQQKASEQEVKEVKKEIAKKVQVKRAKMKKLIQEMRSKSRMRKAALENELNSLRMKMAQDMLQANKNGDIEKCKAGKSDKDKRAVYCNTRFMDDFIRNGDCKSDENFCYMCCESEFGNMFIDRREACYNMCDLPKKKEKKKGGNGPWMWTPTAAK
jgi:hypothetical protein